MKKRLNFLRYILNEDMETMLRKVYEVLKTDIRKGDFVDLVQQDLNDVGLEISENEIENTPELIWKKIVNSKVKEAALLDLVAQNSEKSKTNHIKFETLQMRETQYLKSNKNTTLSKTIFSV